MKNAFSLEFLCFQPFLFGDSEDNKKTKRGNYTQPSYFNYAQPDYDNYERRTHSFCFVFR